MKTVLDVYGYIHKINNPKDLKVQENEDVD